MLTSYLRNAARIAASAFRDLRIGNPSLDLVGVRGAKAEAIAVMRLDDLLPILDAAALSDEHRIERLEPGDAAPLRSATFVPQQVEHPDVEDGSVASRPLADRLKRAFQTMVNDDVSIVGTEARARFVERTGAILDAIEAVQPKRTPLDFCTAMPNGEGLITLRFASEAHAQEFMDWYEELA